MPDPVQTPQTTESQPLADAAAAAARAAAASPSTATTQTETSSAAKTAPEWLAGHETYWDGEKGELKGSDLAKSLKEASDLKASIQAERAGIPETADKYALDLPKDYKLPDGFEIKSDDARIVALRDAAKELDIPQEKFSKLFSKVVQAQVAVETQNRDMITRAVAARDAALGANGAARVDAAQNFLSTFSDDPTVQKQYHAMLFTPAIIELVEHFASASRSGGIPPFTPKGRESAAGDGKPANWGSMSTVDRSVWLRANSQKK